MKKVYLTLTLLLTVLFTGCGMAPLIEMPKIPEPVVQSVETKLNWDNPYNLENEVAVLKGHKIFEGSKVVLNVPSDVYENENSMKQNGQLTVKDDFTTKAFFNIAEQQIERGLLNAGFKVLSRAKFEAKLRDLRDGVRKCAGWDCYYRYANPELKVLMDEVKKQYEKKTISDDEYIQKVAYFKEKLNDDAGQGRDKDELTDIAEVIRAAASAGVQADYILQINEFDSNREILLTKDLNQIQDIRNLIQKYPNVDEEFSKNNLYSCAVTSALLNAKLINVSTGEIVWLGEHRLNELTTLSDLNNLIISIGVNKSVSNGQEVKNFVDRNNTEIARKNRVDKQVKLPEWKFIEKLIMPRAISGSCNLNWVPNKDTSMKLARDVAKELIGTIKTVPLD